MIKQVGGRTFAAISLILLVMAIAILADCSRFASRGLLPGPVMADDGVFFRLYAPGAGRVQLAGNWPGNNWARGDGSVGEADIGLMKAGSNGVWEIVVPLGPGRYQYVFLVDEITWQLDPGNPEEEPGGPVGKTSVVVIFSAGDKLEIR